MNEIEIDEQRAREEFLNHARFIAKYWGDVKDTKENCINGAIFTLLAAMDGCSGIDRIDLLSEGDFWINRDCDLHDKFYIKDEVNE